MGRRWAGNHGIRQRTHHFLYIFLESSSLIKMKWYLDGLWGASGSDGNYVKDFNLKNLTKDFNLKIYFNLKT